MPTRFSGAMRLAFYVPATFSIEGLLSGKVERWGDLRAPSMRSPKKMITSGCSARAMSDALPHHDTRTAQESQVAPLRIVSAGRISCLLVDNGGKTAHLAM